MVEENEEIETTRKLDLEEMDTIISSIFDKIEDSYKEQLSENSDNITKFVDEEIQKGRENPDTNSIIKNKLLPSLLEKQSVMDEKEFFLKLIALLFNIDETQQLIHNLIKLKCVETLNIYEIDKNATPVTFNDFIELIFSEVLILAINIIRECIEDISDTDKVIKCIKDILSSIKDISDTEEYNIDISSENKSKEEKPKTYLTEYINIKNNDLDSILSEFANNPTEINNKRLISAVLKLTPDNSKYIEGLLRNNEYQNDDLENLRSLKVLIDNIKFYKKNSKKRTKVIKPRQSEDLQKIDIALHKAAIKIKEDYHIICTKYNGSGSNKNYVIIEQFALIYKELRNKVDKDLKFDKEQRYEYKSNEINFPRFFFHLARDTYNITKEFTEYYKLNPNTNSSFQKVLKELYEKQLLNDLDLENYIKNDLIPKLTIENQVKGTITTILNSVQRNSLDFISRVPMEVLDSCRVTEETNNAVFKFQTKINKNLKFTDFSDTELSIIHKANILLFRNIFDDCFFPRIHEESSIHEHDGKKYDKLDNVTQDQSENNNYKEIEDELTKKTRYALILSSDILINYANKNNLEFVLDKIFTQKLILDNGDYKFVTTSKGYSEKQKNFLKNSILGPNILNESFKNNEIFQEILEEFCIYSDIDKDINVKVSKKFESYKIQHYIESYEKTIKKHLELLLDSDKESKDSQSLCNSFHGKILKEIIDLKHNGFIEKFGYFIKGLKDLTDSIKTKDFDLKNKDNLELFANYYLLLLFNINNKSINKQVNDNVFQVHVNDAYNKMGNILIP